MYSISVIVLCTHPIQEARGSEVFSCCFYGCGMFPLLRLRWSTMVFSKFNCTSQKQPVSSRMVFPLPLFKASKQLPITTLLDLRKVCLLEVSMFGNFCVLKYRILVHSWFKVRVMLHESRTMLHVTVSDSLNDQWSFSETPMLQRFWSL